MNTKLWRRLLAGLLAMSGVPVTATPDRAVAAPASIVLDGRGFGHGIGLGQYGALGYAVDQGWSSARILDYYYGGTVAATAPDSEVTVRLSALDGAQTAVVHDKAALVIDGVAGGPWRSLVARQTTPGRYAVWARRDANVCPAATADLNDPAGGWAVVVADAASVTTRPATDTSASPDIADLVGLCEPATGRVRYYRGAIRAVQSNAGAVRTVNQVPVEQYIRSVVAGEMSWGWAARGGGRGAQALQAQAVAARSYGLAENREPYANTCDNVCQTYRGAAYRVGVGGAFVAQEFGPIDAAVAATAGVVRRYGSSAGKIAYTMYSSSSGGFTAKNSLGFSAVVDEGDSVAGNAGRSWSASIPTAAIESAYPAIGGFTGVTVVTREGNGEWGGRVLTMRVEGTSGSLEVSGGAFRAKFRLKSNWFQVRGDAGPPSGPAPSGPAPAGPDGACNGRTTSSIAAATANPAASRFTPIAPVRLIDTRIGWGTDQAPLGGGCTLEVDPLVGDDATAVVVNVTAVSPSANGYLTAYPCGAQRPLASIVPAIAGRIVPGAAVVALNDQGRFCVYAMAETEIVIDLSGVYRTAGGDRFEPIPTNRRFDSRTGAMVPGGTVVRVPIAGLGDVPATATGIAATVHSTGAGRDGFITIWPCDSPRPTTSVLNTSAGASVSNHVQVGLGGSGAVCMFAQYPMNLVLDVSGWFGPTATDEYHALMPTRVLDTREGVGLAGAFSAGQDRALTLVGVGGVPASGVSALAAEVTATDAGRAGYITVHPCLSPAPEVSMVRNFAGSVAATTVTGIVDPSGRWCLRPSVAMQMVIDVSGWYG